MSDYPLDERSIFLRAVELNAVPERSAFLDAACGNDRNLRRGVEALLRAHEDSFGLLDAPDQAYGALERTFNGLGPGTFVGQYELLREIGEGGMGAVWMAEQSQPVRRRVALKIIKPGMDSRQVIARFEAERQALALMDHPNIARVLEAGTTESGQPYFVMELVDGVPITKYCDDHDLTLRQRLELFLSVCHAVQHAHSKGIIHRDLKPSNVLVASYDAPTPKIIDFGVAKATTQKLIDRTTFTQCGLLVGTLEYMSPEQASFNNLDIDTRSDVYSLGVLLYELLAGSTPFEKDRLRAEAFDDVLRMIREEAPPRPSARLSDLHRTGRARRKGASPARAWHADGPPSEWSLESIAAQRRTEPARLVRLFKGDLDRIVMKALEKDRDLRYQTASELALDLAHYLAEEPVAASPPSVRYRLQKFARRNRGPVVAASLVVLALVGGMIGTTWGMILATRAQAVAVNEARRKEAALEAARQSEHEATEQLFLALWNQARAGRFSRQMGQRLDSLAALARAAGIHSDERLRDEATAALALPDLRRVPGWNSSPAGTTAVAYGGSHRLYARADSQGFISIYGIPGDHEIRRIASGMLKDYLYFSPDDRFLLGLADGNTLCVWRVSDGQLTLRDGPRGCGRHAFSHDGRRAAVIQKEWVLCFDLETGEQLKRWRLPGRANSVAYHPDDRKLAVGYSYSNVASVYDTANGSLLANLPVGAMTNQVVAWHPDGDRLAVAGSDPRIQIWNVGAKRQVATLEGHVQNVTDVSFHPEGGLVASHGWDGTLLLWQPSSGRQLLRLTAVSDAQFSADGRWLGVAWHGDRADMLEVTPNRELRTIVSSAGAGAWGYGCGDISPDGRLLAVGMDDGARIWDLGSGRELAALPPGTSAVFFDAREEPGARTASPASPRWRLLTSGVDGLQSWPVTSDDAEGKHLRLGPARQLSPLRRATFARGPNGGTLAAVSEEGGPNKILDLVAGTVRQELGSHPQGDVRALSSDGRWAASCGWHSDRVKLWDVGTGRMVHEWVLGKRRNVFFTPDSRALIIARDDEFSFWDVQTLQPLPRLPREVAQYPGWVAFSPDGQLMALEMAPGAIHLKDVAAGRTVAKLADPYGDRARWQGFTPDGTQLVVVATYASAIHIWDLRLIRSTLKEMNLDWEWPEFPPAGAASALGEPMTIEVISAEAAGLAAVGELRVRRTLEGQRRLVQANPSSAQACNNLAWTLVTAPEPLRDANAAVPLAERAVRLAAANAAYRNTLGTAYYRAGRYRDAVAVLRPNLETQRDNAMAVDLFVLAMSLHRLGETARARDYYNCAVRWGEARRDLAQIERDELAAFRAEAAALLGLDRSAD
jgi:serine/threonine protein kinase/WD40 repeat protein